MTTCSLTGSVRRLVGVGFGLTLPYIIAGLAAGQCEITKLTASDGGGFDRFGRSVSIDGDVALVGADLEDDHGTSSGAAYVFRFDGTSWNQEAKLRASDGAPIDTFGRAVSLSGQVALIGSRWDDDGGYNSGSAYVFRFDPETSQWIEEAKLAAFDASLEDEFGYSVSVNGDQALVGSYLDDDNGRNSGSAYVFRYDPETQRWVFESKLCASDGAAGDQFGISVSLSGQAAVVGADRDDDGGPNSGSTYIFRLDGKDWVQEAKLTAPDAAQADLFGLAVSIRGDLAVVGAPIADDGGSNSGAAYVFRFNSGNWLLEAKLTASDAADEDWFGWSVAIERNVALVGAVLKNGAGLYAGAAYVFQFDGHEWIEQAKLLGSDATGGEAFGESVALDGDAAIIGADMELLRTGSAYVFAGLSGADCNDNGESDSCDIADGTSKDVNDDGVPDECECLWDLDADGMVGFPDLLLLVFSFGPCDGDCPADFDGDGFVGVPDLLTLIFNFGPCPDGGCPWDVNGDGAVDRSDLRQVLGNLGRCDGCPEDVDGDGVVDFEDVIAVATHFGSCP